MVVAAIVGVLIGRMISRRDEQVPREGVRDGAGLVPMPRTDPVGLRRSGAEGRYRPRRR